MAEAQDLNQILGYIQEREQTLSKYSDKLRKSLVKIADVFGNPQYCQRCNKWSVFHDEKWKDKPEGKGVCGNFKPKIDVSVDVTDDIPFYKTDEEMPETYYLGITNHNLKIIGVCGNVGIFADNRQWTVWFENASREMLKALVKSGRLIPFLQKVADVLTAKGEEYREVAQVAEKMAQAVQ
jgi:hypothetical protein